jgi:hypothetical protein
MALPQDAFLHKIANKSVVLCLIYLSVDEAKLIIYFQGKQVLKEGKGMES